MDRPLISSPSIAATDTARRMTAGAQPIPGASMIAKILIEDCTELHMFVGTAANSAYQNPGMAFDLGIRQNLVEQLRHLIEDMGKKVVITYY